MLLRVFNFLKRINLAPSAIQDSEWISSVSRDIVATDFADYSNVLDARINGELERGTGRQVQ